MVLLQAFRYLQHHHPYQAWTLLLFVSLVLSIYILAAWSLWCLFKGKNQHPASPWQIWSKRLQNAVMGLAALGIISLLYAFAVEPYWLEVTHVNLNTGKLPRTTSPITIVQISDLHSNAMPRMEEALPDLICREKPDLIVFTGDAINSPAGLPTFRHCLSRLAKIAPTFAVVGNHDVFWQQKDIFQGTGATELKVQALPLKVGDAEIWIAGVPVDHQECDRALQAVPKDAFTIFLDHYPDGLEQLTDQRVDLYLCGHTHGGQVAVPFYGAIVTFSNQGKRYEAGLYKRGSMDIYVNRGIGMDPEPFPQVRFCARPEVTVFKISPVK